MSFIAPKTWAVGEILSAVDMNIYVRDNTNALNEGFRYIGRRIYSPAGSYTFAKADPFGDGSFPGVTARAIRVICIGGGGAGAGGATTTAGQASIAGGGTSGAYAESFFSDLDDLPASVDVIVAEGGAAQLGTTGENGTNSSFASGSYLVLAAGGRGGLRSSARTGLIVRQGRLPVDPADSVGQIVIAGGGGESAIFDTDVSSADSTLAGGGGGGNPLGVGGFGLLSTQTTVPGEPSGFGGGGAGVSNDASTSASFGIAGGDGGVIVDVFI